MAKTDERTLGLIKEVKKQKEEISKAERPNWVTNCSFSFYGGGASINLHVESNLGVLIGISAFLMDREQSYKKAAEALELTDAPPFSWLGFSSADWNKDIKSRINKIQIATKKQKLADLEARLDKIISPELKAELELEAISAELK